jgi:hypothetical protein
MPAAISSMLGSGAEGGGIRLSCDVVVGSFGCPEVGVEGPLEVVVVGTTWESNFGDDLASAILCRAGASFGW